MCVGQLPYCKNKELSEEEEAEECDVPENLQSSCLNLCENELMPKC